MDSVRASGVGAERVAGEHQLTAQRVEGAQRELAVEARERFGPPECDGLDQDLGVGPSTQRDAGRLKRRSDLLKVVELTVEGDLPAAVPRCQPLGGRGGGARDSEGE